MAVTQRDAYRCPRPARLLFEDMYAHFSPCSATSSSLQSRHTSAVATSFTSGAQPCLPFLPATPFSVLAAKPEIYSAESDDYLIWTSIRVLSFRQPSVPADDTFSADNGGR